ncbi:hypothetical protein FUAX_10310 [Fulvitalea axinellae]|uniref:Uncharacterized protein n=1 Tax=Fulvitalea axinellae TaxID=1182444 RepID=A0AAU9D2J7_9BACT|nr:hypothetical protein FUAX_10310 [Fulvitalea axinellae]
MFRKPEQKNPKTRKTAVGSGGAGVLPPVQCYHIVEPERYRAGPSGAEFSSQQWFGDRYTKSKLTFSGRDLYGEGHFQDQRTAESLVASERPKKPRLKVSDAGDLAIEETYASFVFYASEEKIEESNDALSARKAKIRLVKRPFSVIVPDREGIESELFLVEICFDGDQFEAVGESDECIFFMHETLNIPYGKHLNARLNFPGDSEVEEPFNSAESADRVAHKIFTVMSRKGALYPSRALPSYNVTDEALREGQAPVVKRDFEKLPEAVYERQSEHLGINRFADPELCEGLTTYSGPAYERGVFMEERAECSDFESFFDRSMKMGTAKNRAEHIYFPWHFQFAGVIAKSGDDIITLENVHQYSEMMSKFSIEFYHLYKKDRAFGEMVDALGRGNSGLNIRKFSGTVFEYLERLVPYMLDRCALRADTSTKLASMWARKKSLCAIPPNQLFFMNMFSRKPGQTFHDLYEHQIASPSVTLVVRDSEKAWRAEFEREILDLKRKAMEAYRVPGLDAGPLNGLLVGKQEDLNVLFERHLELLGKETVSDEMAEIRDSLKSALGLSVRTQILRINEFLNTKYPGAFKSYASVLHADYRTIFGLTNALARGRRLKPDGNLLAQTRDYLQRLMDLAGLW